MRRDDLRLKFERHMSAEAVLVYQMGKVGSTALEMALPNAIHVHNLYRLAASDVYIPIATPNLLEKAKRKASRILKRSLLRRYSSRKIVCYVRQPADRNISMFFQDLPGYLIKAEHGFPRGFATRMTATRGDTGIHHLVEVFLTCFDHQSPDAWFDQELRRLTGIDVFSHPFDEAKGYAAIADGGWQVFIGRIESLPQHLGDLETFLGHELALTSRNVASEKWYGCVYNQFIQALDMAAYRRQLQALRVAEHFYSEPVWAVEGEADRHRRCYGTGGKG